MEITVRFHGFLRKLCPEIYKVIAETPAEAIRGLTNQLKKELIRTNGHRFVCRVKGYETIDSLHSSFRGDSLDIYPEFSPAGGGNSSWISIALGAVLIVGMILLGPAGWAGIAGVGAGFFSASVATGVTLVGTSLVLQGLIGLLTPVPKATTSESDPERSRFFGSNKNTTQIGTRIAVGYGRYKIFGQLVSLNTQAVDK